MDPLGNLHDELYNAGIPIFNRHGTYLTREEREEMARRQGLCERCGTRTMKGRLRRTPITDKDVYKGICIRCFPGKVPMAALQEYEKNHQRGVAPVAMVASATAAGSANATSHPAQAMTMPPQSGASPARAHPSLQTVGRVVQASNRTAHAVGGIGGVGGVGGARPRPPVRPTPPAAAPTRTATSTAARPTPAARHMKSSSATTLNTNSASNQASTIPNRHQTSSHDLSDRNHHMNSREMDPAEDEANLSSNSMQQSKEFDQNSVTSGIASSQQQPQRQHIRSGPQEDYSGGMAGANRAGQKKEEESALKGLRQNHDKPEVIRKYMHRLRNEGGGFDDFNGACMAEVYDLMDRYRSDTRLLAVACGSLWRLTIEEEQKLQAAETGVVELIIESIARESNWADVDLMEWAMGCLASMALVADNKAFIAERGGIEHAIEAMRALPDVGGVFLWGCRCLHTLLCEFDDEDEEDSKMLESVLKKNLVSIHENQGLAAITAALGNPNHARDPNTLRWGLKLLWRLFNVPNPPGPDRALKKMINVNFVGVAVKIMKARSTTAELFLETVELLRWVLLSPDSVVELSTSTREALYSAASDCIPGIMRMMAENADVDGMQVSCCRILATLASGSREARHLVQESSGGQAIVTAIEKNPDNGPLIEAGCWAMWTMSSGDLFFRDSRLLPRANKAIQIASEKHANSPSILYPLCGYYGNVCTIRLLDSSDNIPIPLLVKSLQVFKDNADGMREAQRAISNVFCKFPGAVDHVSGEFNVDELVQYVVETPSSVNKSLIGVLIAMSAKSEDVRNSMVSAALFPCLVAMLEKKYSEISTSSASFATTLLSLCLSIMELMALLLGDPKRSVSTAENSVQLILNVLNRFVANDTTDSTSRDKISEYNATLEKTCILLRNLLLASSSRLDLDGLVDCIISKIIDPDTSSAELRMEGCAVLWAFSAKYPSKCANEVCLQRMFVSILNAISKHKGASPGAPYHVGLQNVASASLCSVTNNARKYPFTLESDYIDELVSLPYTALDCDPDSLDVFEKLLEIILNLSYFDELALVQGGVIVVVIDTMAEFEQNATIQELGCSILALLAATENLQVNLSIVQTDGIDMIINALALFPGNISIESQACKALSHLSIDQESRILISSLGGIMLLGNCMKANMDVIGLLEGCCTAILNLSSDADDALLLGSNIIDIVIHVMRRHPDSASIQENGMGILQNISMRSLEAKKTIADAGGILAVTIAIKEHMGRASVLERAFTTLWSLAVLDLNQPLIADSNGISLVVNGMMTAIMSERVQKQGCGCLCTLSSNSENKGIIQNIGGVDSIVYAMWAHYSSEDIQIEACRALSSLAVDVHTNEVMIASEGEVNAIVSAMRRFPHSERLQEHSCVALRNFLLSADNVDVFRMSQNEVYDVVSRAAQVFPNTCQERANQILSSLR